MGCCASSTRGFKIKAVNPTSDIDDIVNLHCKSQRLLNPGYPIDKAVLFREKKQQLLNAQPQQCLMLKVVRTEDGIIRSLTARREKNILAIIIVKAPVPHVVKKTNLSLEVGDPQRPRQAFEPPMSFSAFYSMSNHPQLAPSEEFGRGFHSSPIREVDYDPMESCLSARKENRTATRASLPVIQENPFSDIGNHLAATQDDITKPIRVVPSNVADINSDDTGSTAPSSVTPEEDPIKPDKTENPPTIQAIDFNHILPSLRETHHDKIIRKHKEAFGGRYQSRMWEIVGLITDEDCDWVPKAELESQLVRKAFKQMQAGNLKAEGVCVVTTDQRRLYEQEGFTVVKEESLSPGAFKESWMLKRFPKPKGMFD